MKITIYTINDCVFSKQEKDFLVANKLAFEEKNLETNKEFLTEMLAVSNNFAGTPVTKIEKDDGQIVVLKGFTLEEFNKALNLTPIPTSTAPKVEETHVDMQAPVAPTVPQANNTLPPLDIPAPATTAAPPQPSVVPAPVMPVTPTTVPQPPDEPVATTQAPMPAAPPTPVAPQTGPSNDQLNSILTDLQNKVNQPDLNPPPTPTSPNPDMGKTN